MVSFQYRYKIRCHRQDDAGKKYGESKNRIDGALGFIICYAAFSENKSEYFAMQEAR